jgi:hypothetical protein
MLAVLAFGVAHRLGSGTWDFLPLVATVGLLLAARALVGVRIGPAAIAIAAFAGLIYATLAERWGPLPVTFASAALLIAASRLVRPPHRG